VSSLPGPCRRPVGRQYWRRERSTFTTAGPPVLSESSWLNGCHRVGRRAAARLASFRCVPLGSRVVCTSRRSFQHSDASRAAIAVGGHPQPERIALVAVWRLVGEFTPAGCWQQPAAGGLPSKRLAAQPPRTAPTQLLGAASPPPPAWPGIFEAHAPGSRLDRAAGLQGWPAK